MIHLRNRKPLYFLQHSGHEQNENLLFPNVFNSLGIIENTCIVQKEQLAGEQKLHVEHPIICIYAMLNL